MFGYTGNEEITKGLLNAILKEKVTDVSLNCNTILERDLYDDKLGILDIRAKVNNSVDVNVEMQLVAEKNIEKTAKTNKIIMILLFISVLLNILHFFG